MGILEWLFGDYGFKIGTQVTCDDNFYGRSKVCTIEKIYYRIRGGSKVKFFRLSFMLDGQVKTINCYWKSCRLVGLGE